jgi:hypothetical protein
MEIGKFDNSSLTNSTSVDEGEKPEQLERSVRINIVSILTG